MFKQISNIFQRIVYSEEELQSHIKPISFAIPEEVICENVPIKTKSFAYNIPGKQETYIYNNEIGYFKGYQESYFGITMKKWSWDSLRHYEILANGCIPYFIDLEKCPSNILHNYPKELILNAVKLTGLPSIKNVSGLNETDLEIDFSVFDQHQYNILLQKLLSYTRKNLTTKALAKYVLETCRLPLEGQYLILRACDPKAKKKADYQRNLLIHGLHSIGAKIYCYPKFEYLYDTFPEERVAQLYGKGFTYARKLKDPNLNVSFKHIEEKIAFADFDGIIYTTQSNVPINIRKTSFFRLIQNHYSPSKIIFIDGRDNDSLQYDEIIQEFHCFKREFRGV